MDVWVVAAAAGAGFVVQRLKNLNLVRTEVSSSTRDAPDNSCPLRRVLWREKMKGEIPEKTEMVSTTVPESENSLSGFFKYQGFEGELDDRLPSDSEEILASDSLPRYSSSELGVSYVFRRNRSSVRSRRTNLRFIKPQTSLESCVMAQLYERWGEAEEFAYAHGQMHKPIVRPFVVSDGRRAISSLPIEPLIIQTETVKNKLLNDAYVMENKAVLGIPELPYVVLGESKRKAKTRKEKKPILRTNGSHENKNVPRDGPPDKALHFCNGFTMGIISSLLGNKQEMDKLNKLLKQSDNLVQDLQEELEMKDSLTVKELSKEHCESHGAHNESCYSDDIIHASSTSYEREADNSIATPDQTSEEESLSRIEAELEAELERLESNMNSSRLEGKLSKVAELNPNIVSDFAKGELRADLFGANSGRQTYADRDGSGIATPHALPRPVSPRELALRLHEVIQSRLEQRIEELELALEDSQMKLKNLESSPSSSRSSPVVARVGGHHLISDQPVVINLSGEALSSYNEAFEELTKASESDDEDMQSESEEDYVSYLRTDDYLRRTQLNDEEDEVERLLIRQIIEKAKQGSPAVLKAQRAFLFAENRH